MFKKKKDVRPWDLLKGPSAYTTKDVSEERMSICKSCPNFLKLTKQCKLCLCIMPAKVILADAYCPIDKWKASNEIDNTDMSYLENNENFES